MKKIIVLGLLALLLCSCSSEEKKNDSGSNLGFQVIDCAKKNGLMDEEKAILIDVRTVQEYSEGHLDGSVNISVESINTMIETMVKDKNAHIIVYCRSGNRSAAAAQTLINLGYKNVYDLGAMDNCSK